MSRNARIATAALAIVAGTALAARAQKAGESSWPAATVAPAPASPAKPADAAARRPAATAARTRPGALAAEDVLYLARATLLALNDANRTGNYSVLRDLSSSGFKATHTTEGLARIFAGFREQRFNMGAVALITPQLTSAPQIDAKGLLRLAGQFPTAPMAIRFELAYARDGADWRLADLGVSTVRLASLPAPVRMPPPSPAASRAVPQPAQAN